ncbi:hypothetical protein SpCBS45565_g05861 [Spizellomyces sp. 'palustris']|nr:hypothetical protein SpCBS45565_g05861 [Spizellomyces sp. 'palustris']
MPLQYPQRVWQLARDVAAKGPLADPRRLGGIPFDLKQYRRIIPTFMHGKQITFGDNISEKGSNRTRRAFLPNVIYRPLYSRTLDMNIWTRLSTHALREVDAKGGFDEYILTLPDKYLECDVAKMYKRKITDGYYGAKGGKVKVFRAEMESLLGSKYGEEYLTKLKESERTFDKAVKR